MNGKAWLGHELELAIAQFMQNIAGRGVLFNVEAQSSQALGGAPRRLFDPASHISHEGHQATQPLLLAWVIQQVSISLLKNLALAN